MKKYWLSWRRLDPVKRLVRPKWWQFWRTPYLVTDTLSVRHMIKIDEDCAAVVIEAANKCSWASPTARLLRAVMGPDASFVQLEEDSRSPASNYIRTSGL